MYVAQLEVMRNGNVPLGTNHFVAYDEALENASNFKLQLISGSSQQLELVSVAFVIMTAYTQMHRAVSLQMRTQD